MNKRSAPVALRAEHVAALRHAAAMLQRAKASSSMRPHRSMRRHARDRLGIGLALGTALGLTLAVWAAKPWIAQFWEHVIAGWANRLGIGLVLLHDGSASHWLNAGGNDALQPGRLAGVATAALVIAAWGSTLWMPDRLTPLKYAIRVLCAVQASAIAWFALVPGSFPYTAGSHLGAMLAAGYSLMLVIPSLLAVGYVLLDLPLHRRLLGPPGVLAFFVLEVPHKAVLHVWLVQQFSLLLMPVLYLFFGLLFDVMLFIALYSWMVSSARLRTAG